MNSTQVKNLMPNRDPSIFSHIDRIEKNTSIRIIDFIASLDQKPERIRDWFQDDQNPIEYGRALLSFYHGDPKQS